jgi:predicted DNA binding protein
MVGDHESVSERIREFSETGADVLIQTIGEYDGPVASLNALTERQQEVLETAFEMGYFEVPRETTTEAVADELDIDPSTAREHLQRAQRNLLATFME